MEIYDLYNTKNSLILFINFIERYSIKNQLELFIIRGSVNE